MNLKKLILKKLKDLAEHFFFFLVIYLQHYSPLSKIVVQSLKVVLKNLLARTEIGKTTVKLPNFLPDNFNQVGSDSLIEQQRNYIILPMLIV